MRQSKLFGRTLREVPAEAEVANHQLMLRAGLIKQHAAGIYSILPLGWRVLRNIERIIREELEQVGAQELVMPALQPAELWRESERYDDYGPELMRLRDRHDREFVLGPTHEEVITKLAKSELHSYRQLPVMLFQIQTKYRDERRPRFGLLRSREFVMKDAYSFDRSWEGLDEAYRTMYAAYQRIFERCGLNYRIVEADAGTIGGEGETHEFMALASIGEDHIVICDDCGYTANLEKAEVTSLEQSGSKAAASEKVDKLYTPNVRTIDELTSYLNILASQTLKTLLYMYESMPIAVVVRGDHEVNDLKLKHVLGGGELELAASQEIEAVFGVGAGFVGPVGLTIPIWVDTSVSKETSYIVGGNEVNYHRANVVPGRDFSVELVADLRNAVHGDPCPRCEIGAFELINGVEVGHIFKLGTQYSAKLGANLALPDGTHQDIVMGCYGIGVTRLLAAVIEQHHDERGIVWPSALAPFQVHLIPVSVKDDVQMTLVQELYDQLRAQGIAVLLDDRDERAGVKFADAELIGIPYRITIGKLAPHGQVEVVERQLGVKQIRTKDEVLAEWGIQ